ncbi:MAG TPA: hypothetical protein VE172_01020 [Stackebrandtia sp.]|uniref:hypothetical protein n=1 Tax=Stackebrandtia sp. TaxID=2023065 RepID=UPI002D223AE1|nr:hypothetical protein [Stackebrandtia sp.]HZE37372.1 hypothetical protein [Stackebrandtia sp.]
MRVAPAEIVRTLAAGHRPANVHIAWSDVIWNVPAATDPQGTPLLLVPDDGRLADCLRQTDGLDAAVALRFDDEPPLPCAPWLGSGWVSGWAEPVPAAEQRATALRFHDANPLPRLLDVGHGVTLWTVDVAEVRLEYGERVTVVEPEQYAAAEPDPLYPIEVELLLDLFDHHPEVIAALTHRVRHVIADAARVIPLRINRHGVIADVHRADHPDPRRCFIRHRGSAANLREVLHDLACCDCAPRS